MTTHRDVRDHARVALWSWLAALGGGFALAPLTESRAYVVVGIVSTGLVCLIGLGLRVLRMPWPLILLAQLGVLFWWTVLTYANETLTFGVVPTGNTFSELDAIVTRTLDHAQQYAAPVPDHASLHALLVIAVGLLAVIIDLLAGSLRHAPAVGLVFLGIYMTPIALLSGQVSLWFFLPGALTFVFLLAAEERSSIARWGRNISYADSASLAQTRGIYSSGLTTAGRRVGFGAVALAVVLPLLIPTFSTNLFGSGGIGGNGPGDRGSSGDVKVDNPFLDMRTNLVGQSPKEMLRISGVEKPEYVRLAALDALSTSGWSVSDRGPKTQDIDGVLPSPRGLDPEVERSLETFEVEVTDNLESRWLPTIAWPTSIANAEGDWLIDSEQLDVVAGDGETNAKGMEYRLNVSRPSPSRQQFRNAEAKVPNVLEPFVDLPDSTPEVVETRAREITEDADGPFEKAAALQDWFRRSGGFTYNLEPEDSGNGMETIESFLTDDREGYCEQFASAMAMMARSLDIPARVAVGFLSGDRFDDTYVFRGTDMHAWPELYLDGIGWVRFEPTPGQRTGPPPAFDSDSAGTAESDIPRNENPNSRSMPNDANSPSANLDNSAAGGSDGGSGGSSFPWTGALVAGGLLAITAALALVPRWLRSLRRQRRWGAATDPAHATEAAWDELRDTVLDLRMPWPTGSTPRAAGRRLRPMVQTREQAIDALNRIVLAVERSRYAQNPVATDLRSDVDAVSEALASRVSKRTRRKALWWPVSLLGGLRLTRGGRNATDRTPHHELLALEE